MDARVSQRDDHADAPASAGPPPPGGSGSADAAAERVDGTTGAQTAERVLCLCDDRGTARDLQERLGPSVEVVAVRSPARVVTKLAQGGFKGVYADADHFAPAADTTQLIHNVQILAGMPDGVVLLDRDHRIVWGNGRLREWMGRGSLFGEVFDDALGRPEVLGSEPKPLDAALSLGEPSVATLRLSDGRFFRLHAAPVAGFDGEAADHLIVTVRDVTAEQLERQKLTAIHQAGLELSDLTPDEIAEMEIDERVEILKDNILRGTQDVLQYDVVEVRALDEESGELRPLVAHGISDAAVGRVLRAEATGNGVTGFVAASAKSYLCEDTSEDPIYLEGAEGARSSLTVPLMLNDRVIGTFNVESPDAHAFTESDRLFLEIFSRDVAAALNTMQLMAVEKASTAVESVEKIHSAVALPVDDILNDAVNVMERYIGHEPEVVERLQRILRNAREVKQVIQEVGQSLAPSEALPAGVRVEERPLLRGRRVLVADADGTVRSAAHDLLERYGCAVETAHDGAEALSMARSGGAGNNRGRCYDAILSDIRLPDMSGYELMVALNGQLGEAPLILMTGFGYDPGHVLVKARQAGLKAVLYKPFRLDQLVENVEKVVSESDGCPPDGDA
ncbi:MAG: response regulator [Planctomycetota bacterium]